MLRFATLMHALRLALAAAAIATLAPASQAQQQAPMVGIEPIRAALGEIETAMRRSGLSMRAQIVSGGTIRAGDTVVVRFLD